MTGGAQMCNGNDANVIDETAKLSVGEKPGYEDDCADLEAVTDIKAKKSRKKKSKKKAFVPLPSLAAVEDQLPWGTAFSQRLGRHGVAKQDIAAGTLVLEERAVAFVPREAYAAQICHCCAVRLPEPGSAAASGIPTVPQSGDYKRYCSAACLAKRAVRDGRTAPLYPDIPRIAALHGAEADLLRLVLELDACRAGAGATAAAAGSANGALAETAASSNGRPSSAAEQQRAVARVECTLEDVEALLTHVEKVPDAWRKAAGGACSALHDAIAHAGVYAPGSPQQLLHLAAVINGNSHGVGAQDSHNTDVGVGLFPATAMLNHSCRPNCSYSIAGDVMRVRTVRDMRAGTQLTVGYVNLMEPRAVRRRQLAESKHFLCACERCSEPLAESTDRFLEGLLCPKKGCSGVVVLQPPAGEQPAEEGEGSGPWGCLACGQLMPAVGPNNSGGMQVTDIGSRLFGEGLILWRAQRHKEARLRFEAVLAQSGAPGQLHPWHVHAFDSLTPLLNCCRAAGDHAEAISRAHQLVAAMEGVLGPTPSPELGNFLELIGQMSAERAATGSLPPALRARARKQAAEAFQRALDVRCVCLGEDHPTTQATARSLKILH